MRVSVSGRNVFSFTGCFSSSSSVSRPSMTLCGTEERKVWAAATTTTQEMSISVLQSSTERWHTFQTLCTSYPDEVVWHMWWKTGNRWCLGRCLPLKPLLWHYAEMKGGVLWQWYGIFNNNTDDMGFLRQQQEQQQQQHLLEEILTLRCSLYSSSNLRPHMLVPPLPVPERFIWKLLISFQALQWKIK